MINPTLAAKATKEDTQLLDAVHPVGSRLLHFISTKWSIKRVPAIGVILSDAEMVREVFMDKQNFTKIGDGASSALWTPIIGDYGIVNMDGDVHLQLKRNLAGPFSNRICVELVQRVFSETRIKLEQRLLSGEPVDVVHEVAQLAYRTLWELIGLPQSKISDRDFEEAVETLRSVTEGMTVTKKTLSPSQITVAREKLQFVEQLGMEAYRNATDDSSIPGLLKQEGFDEAAAVSVVKSLMITGTETIISFLPRMTALFIKTDYLNYLTTDPDHLGKGINEALRVTVPTPVAARIAKTDMIFHGVKVKAGERMVLSTIEASRRYGNFNPFQELDKNIRGLWFGAGVHLCLGVPLALAEATALAELLLAVRKQQPITIIKQTANTKGHTGSYKELVIQCKLS